MSIKSKELREKRANLVSQGRDLINKAEADKRDLSSDEVAQYDKIMVDVANLKTQYERIERLEQAEREVDRVEDHGLGDSVSHVDGKLPGQKKPLNTAEAIEKALTGWINDAVTEDTLAAAEQAGIRLKKNTVAMPLRTNNRQVMRDYRNSLTAGGAAAGASTIAQGFVPALEMAMMEHSSVLQVADVLRTSKGNDLPWPTADDTSNEGEQVGEEANVDTEADPLMGELVMKAYKFSSKLVKASYELIEDSEFDVATLLGSMLGERLGRILQRRFTLGTGVNQPLGVVTAAPVGVTAASPTVLTLDHLVALSMSMSKPYRRRGSFMANDKVWSGLNTLKDTQGRFLIEPAVQVGEPDRFRGYAVLSNDFMVEAAAANAVPLLFGDFNYYKVRLVGQLRAKRFVERFADKDQEGFIAFMRADGRLLKPQASTTKSPILALKMAAV
jgi:HK97 family phage major capsid protein